MEFAAFLAATEHATLVDGEAVSFGEPAAEAAAVRQGSCKTPLTAYGVVTVSGADAREFLHGQFTTDCRALATGHTQLSAWCSPKGRVLFVLRLIAHDDGFDIILPRAQVAAFNRRLAMYVLRAKVVVADRSDATVVFGLLLAQTDTWRPATVELPDDTLHVASGEHGFRVLRIGRSPARFIAYGDAGQAESFWRRCPLAPVGTEAWRLTDIDAGLPVIGEATTDQFLPQSLNLDALDAVSFRKGCYPGQEIVTRVRSRGTLKRRMYLARGVRIGPVAPGTRLFRQGDASGESVGRVLVAALEPADGTAMLVVADIGTGGRDIICVGAPDGPALARLVSPPYPFA